MKNTSISILLATILSLTVILLGLFLQQPNFALGIFISSAVLIVNLWMWFFSGNFMLSKNSTKRSFFTVLKSLRIMALFAALFLILFYFDGVILALSNCIVMFSLIVPPLIENLEIKRMNNGF